MKIHELKTWPEFYQAMVNGEKSFLWRKDDRGFQLGDLLLLREYEPAGQEYTGREQLVRVDYLLGSDRGLGIPDGYVIMGITRVNLQVTEVKRSEGE